MALGTDKSTLSRNMWCNIVCKGKSKQEWLKTFLKLEYGIPDACTFRNIIKEIDTQKLHTLFCEWMKSVASELTGVIAIVGMERYKRNRCNILRD